MIPYSVLLICALSVSAFALMLASRLLYWRDVALSTEKLARDQCVALLERDLQLAVAMLKVRKLEQELGVPADMMENDLSEEDRRKYR